MKEGLADNWVHDVLMDKSGTVWLATHDGLSRYDGNHFKNYKAQKNVPDVLPGAVLMDIEEGENDTYWIACNGLGLIEFDAHKEIFELHSVEIDDAEISKNPSLNAAVKIFIDGEHQIWMGTYGGGLHVFSTETEKFGHFEMPEEPISSADNFTKNSVSEIVADPLDSNKLWLGTHDGIFNFDKKTGQKTHYPLFQKGYTAFVVSMLTDPSGIIWVATENHGLIEFDSKTGNAKFLTEPMQVKAMLRKSEDELWVATIGKGLGIYHLGKKTWQFITEESTKEYAILSNDIYGLYADADERLWVCDMAKGVSVSKGTGSLFKKPEMDEAVKRQLIAIKRFAFAPLEQTLFVISTNMDKVFLFQKELETYVFSKSISLPVPPSPLHKTLDIICDRKGQIWLVAKIGEGVQVFLWEKEREQFIKKDLPRLEQEKIGIGKLLNLAEDRVGNIWLAFPNGMLFAWNDDSMVTKKIGNNLPFEIDPGICDIIFDKKNNLWASSLSDGVFMLPPNEDEVHFSYQKVEGLGSWRILSTVEMKNGKMWLGTSGAGINELNPAESPVQKVLTYNQRNGMPDEKINSLRVDTAGNVWIASMRGLLKYSPKYDHFNQFADEEGLGNTALDDGFEYLENGDLLLGQPFGFQFLKTANTIDKDEPHPVFLSSFLVNGEVFPTEQSLEHIEKLELAPDDNYFTIEFSAKYYDRQDKINYRYILENYDPSWTTPQRGKAQAKFTNVPPGKYVFKVLASNSDGQWATEMTELPIVIYPPWYWSLGMKIIYALLLLGGIIVAWRFQRRKWEVQSQLQMQQNESLRLKELDEMKSRFFANVSHELRTPLTLILGPINSLMKSQEINKKQFTLLKTAQQSGKDLLKLVGSILDLSKMESGKLTLVEKPELLFPLVRRIVSTFESHAQRSEIQMGFDYKIPQELCFALDREKIELVLNNLLSNAIKFTPSQGKITIVTEDLGNLLQFSVQDTGRGIHPNDLPNIFDRFYQSNQPNIATEGGTGIGLAVSQEFVKLMGGKIWVESELGKGSIFCFQIPRKEILGWKEADDLNASETEVIEALPVISEIQKSTQVKNPQKSTVLIVEDNYSLRNYLELILSPHFNVMTAENGQVALDHLAKLKNKNLYGNQAGNAILNFPDLILSDIMMPVMDGYQLLKTLKTTDEFRHLPVVMLTARADTEDRLAALRIGVDDYLVKPFEEEELLVRIKNLLKNAEGRKSFQSEEAPEKVENPEPAKIKITEAEQAWVAKLEKTILLHVSDSRFNMDFLGEKMGVSRRTLQRKIDKLVGLTPKAYVNEIRLHESRRLLEKGEVSTVKKAAELAGFAKTEYFSHQFKERFGKVPSDFLI